uniref:Uncharacterized protein n=1 Tax=Quercus lobata TaxID=97700 RepID=A0A7N2LL54_QUELO
MQSGNNCLLILNVVVYPLLKKLSILNCRELQFPTYPCYSSLESLYISYSCNTLKSFPLHIFPKLRVLRIETCGKMEPLSVLEGHHLIDLMSLKIEDCPNFVAFPAPNLIRLVVNKCQRLNSMPTNMHRLLPSLQHLEIRNCPQLKSFPKGGLPSNLVLFRIDVSEKLFATRMDWGLKRLHSFTTLILYNLAMDAKPLQTAQEAQHVTAPSVHFDLTSMSSPTPVFTIKIIKLTRQWSRGTGGEAGPRLLRSFRFNFSLFSVVFFNSAFSNDHVDQPRVLNGAWPSSIKYPGPGGLFEFIKKRQKEMVIVMQDKGFFLKAWAPATSRMLLKISYSRMWVYGYLKRLSAIHGAMAGYIGLTVGPVNEDMLTYHSMEKNKKPPQQRVSIEIRKMSMKTREEEPKILLPLVNGNNHSEATMDEQSD